MSLLLDALKKAADDKEKNAKEGAVQQDDNESSSNESAHAQTEELSLQEHSNLSLASLTDDSEELQLDDVDTTQETLLISDQEQSAVQQDELRLEKKQKASNRKSDSDMGERAISDDALSMLIYKTNRHVKNSNKILYSSIFIITLLILISGGVFYYSDMENEIEALERKHRIAMQAMRSKTNKEKTPEKTEIIRNLVSDADLEAKVSFAQKHMASKKAVVHEINKKQSAKQISEPVLSVERTNKLDPVGALLDDAWIAYEDAHYLKAKQLYKDVLKREEDNRDALLGLGAIAVIEKERAVARNIYLILLDLDPRDAIATAALASLHTGTASLASDKDYLLSMLDKNPTAPHLNFALGNVYAQLNKWAAAQQYYFNAWQNDNENADYIFNLAVSMDQLSKQKQAVKFYKDSLLKAIDKQVSFSRKAVQKRIDELAGL